MPNNHIRAPKCETPQARNAGGRYTVQPCRITLSAGRGVSGEGTQSMCDAMNCFVFSSV